MHCRNDYCDIFVICTPLILSWFSLSRKANYYYHPFYIFWNQSHTFLQVLTFCFPTFCSFHYCDFVILSSWFYRCVFFSFCIAWNGILYKILILTSLRFLEIIIIRGYYYYYHFKSIFETGQRTQVIEKCTI